MLALIEKVRYSIAALILGVCLVVLASYRIVDIKAFHLEPLPAPNRVILLVGIGLIGISVIAGAVSQFGDALWLPSFARNVKKTSSGWCARVGGANINLGFGRVEELAKPISTALVVLPANEFFDDECITDTRSALGAFVQQHFAKQKADILFAVQRSLIDVPTVHVERAKGEMRASYQVGSTAYLSNALNSGWNILLVAVTTQRAGEGLRAEIRTIFTLANAIETTMADHRLTDVVVPLIGSGHGGLRKPAALSALLVAFIEVLRRPAGHGIRNVTIAVFQEDARAKPSISQRLARRTMARAIDLYGE